MKVLIIGAGARAHAIARACSKSPRVTKVVVAPGNDGMVPDAECHFLDLSNLDGILQFVLDFKPNLVIVGPEGPVGLGLVDLLRSQDILVYGASQKLIQFEDSKRFARQFMHKYGIPTPSFAQFDDASSALDCLKGERFPTVIKSDGLRDANGVVIAHSYEQAQDAVTLLFDSGTLTGKKTEVLIEEYIKGEEVAITVMVCGQNYLLFPFTQDYTRLNDNDLGSLTPGMGSYAPTPLISPNLKELIIKNIVEPTIYGFKHEGFDYRGTLQISIILTPQGPKAIDFKVRFGDPSCQALMPLFETDPFEAFLSCAQGTLDPSSVRFSSKASIVIVKVAQGYPFAFKADEPIHIPTQLPEGTAILHSGSKRQADGALHTHLGRVIHINAVANTLVEAAMEGYALCQETHFASEHYRKDIALKVINEMA